MRVLLFLILYHLILSQWQQVGLLIVSSLMHSSCSQADIGANRMMLGALPGPPVAKTDANEVVEVRSGEHVCILKTHSSSHGCVKEGCVIEWLSECISTGRSVIQLDRWVSEGMS